MLNKFSNWSITSYSEDLSDPNALLSNEQEDAKHNLFKIIENMQEVAAEPLSIGAIANIIMSIDNGKDEQEAYAIAQEFINNPIHNEIQPEPAPEMENEVSQEQMMQTPEMDTLNSMVPPNAPPPGSTMAKTANDEMVLLDAIKDMIDQVVNTQEIPVEDAVLLAAEEALDAPVDSIEELDSRFPGLAEKVHDMISRANAAKQMRDNRSLAENDPDEFVDRFAKYPGHHGDKPGDKKHLKGKGPVNDKANEIYHAIMRDKDIKGEPSEEDKSSAAAIAWSQAKKNKKKAFLRGQEVEILDTYRDMWGENISKIRVSGKIIDVPREAMEFKTEKTLSDIEQLIDFVGDLPRKASTQSQMKARIANLKTAKDMARKILLNEDLTYGEQRALDSIHIRCSAELSEVEERLDNFATEEDLQKIAELPTYEIGKEIYASAFTQHSADWLDGAAEDAASNVVEDVDKFVREDPILMITDLPEEMMSDAGAVRSHAKRRVASAAAYLNEDIRQEFITKYIENAENARRNALRISKIEKSQKIQNKKTSFNSVPDEGLYL